MADLLATHLRTRILRGEFKPGDTLPPETDLMADLQVSRPTLREALRILETESLISVHRGARGGARVLKPDLSVAARYVGLVLQVENTTIVDVYQTRLVLEPACARLLAEAADPAIIAELRACIDELRSVVEADGSERADPSRWAELSYQFHEVMVKRSGSNTQALLGGVLLEIVRTHFAVAIALCFDDERTRTGSPGPFAPYPAGRADRGEGSGWPPKPIGAPTWSARPSICWTTTRKPVRSSTSSASRIAGMPAQRDGVDPQPSGHR